MSQPLDGSAVAVTAPSPITSTMLNAALAYAAHGWPVLPLHNMINGRCSCGKKCGKPAKHPWTEHGLDDASTDLEVIRRWWTKWPDANIGIRTGPESGIVVLDVDGPDGEASLAALLNGSGPPQTPTARTGKGRHLLFAHPGRKVGNAVRKLPGLDVRGDGGYIVAPPSIHENGTRYSWELRPGDVPLAPMPEWLLALLEKPKPRPATNGTAARVIVRDPAAGASAWAEAALSEECERVAQAKEGTRNHTLFCAAANLGEIVAGGGLERARVEVNLYTAAEACGLVTDDGEAAVRATVRSGIEKGMQSPRGPKDDGRTLRLVDGNRMVAGNVAPAVTMPPVEVVEPYPALDLDGEPEPIDWVLEDFLPDRSITLTCGGAGEGKSTLLGAQALSVTSGVPPWRGGKAPTAMRPVVYLDAEMGSRATVRMFRRLRAGLGLEHTPSRLVVYSDPGAISLLTIEGLQRIEATVRAIAERHGAPPVLMLDTLTAVLSGLESFNDAARVEPIYANLFRWRDDLGVTIVVGHHPRKRSKGDSTRPTLDMVRDSSTHVGKCSDVLFGRRPTPDAPYMDVYTLKCRGRDPVPVQRIGYQSDGPGKPIVLTLLEAPQPADDVLVLKAQGLIMSFLHENGGTSRRAAILERLESLGVSERTADRALESLVSLRAVYKPKRGTYSIRVQATVLGEEEE